jgi:hypothetical protein
MTKSKIEDKWNEIFIQLLDELNRIFPESKASSYKMQFKLSHLINNKPPITIFLDGVQEHGKEIMNEDSAYFFNNNIEFVEHLDLSKYYKKSSENNKNIIWKYIKTLYILSEGYHNNGKISICK